MELTAALALVQQFLNASLKLALLDFAAAETLVEIAHGGIRSHHAQEEADVVGLPPRQTRDVGAARARDCHVHSLWQIRGTVEFGPALCSLMLRTMLAVVEPGSFSSVTPPQSTLPSTFRRPSKHEISSK
jgi:hypothetical protein